MSMREPLTHIGRYFPSVAMHFCVISNNHVIERLCHHQRDESEFAYHVVHTKCMHDQHEHGL